MLSFRTMFDAERSKGMTARIGFRLGGEDFLATIENGIFQAARGEPDDADAVFTGSAATLAAAVYGGQPLDALAKAGALETTGDRALAERFITLRSEEHTSELQSLMRNSYDVFFLKKKKKT